MGLREEDKIKVIMAGIFLLGLVGLLLTGSIPGIGGSVFILPGSDTTPVWIDDYLADFYLNGTLDESLHYGFSGDDPSHLFRRWGYPVSSVLDRPYVQILSSSAPTGSLAYEWDWQNQLKITDGTTYAPAIPSDLAYTGTVASLAEKNEVGCFDPGYFGPGPQEIEYRFKIHPFVEYDDLNSHVNIKLADEHLPYDHVEIVIHDPQGYIEHLFPHPEMAVEMNGSNWVITGSSPANGLLEVEMLLKPVADKMIDGFPRQVLDVKGKTLSANSGSRASSLNAENVGRYITAAAPSTGGVRVREYAADMYLNGSINERFVYWIQNDRQFRMLYRTWKIPVSRQEMNIPYVELLGMKAPQGTVPYANLNGITRILDTNGSFYSDEIYNFLPINSAIRSAAGRNGAGFYFQDGAPRSSLVKYRARIHPWLQCDKDSCLVSLNLSSQGLPFKHIELKVHDPEGKISQIFVNPRLRVSKDGGNWIISGESDQLYPLAIKMLLDPGAASAMQGFAQPSMDVRGRVLQEEADAVRNGKIISMAVIALSILLRGLVLAAPLLLLFVYRRYGQERTFLVPSVLSTVPSFRKPWVVNLVFKDDPFDFDEDGFYATILDLQRRNILDTQSDDSWIRITLQRGQSSAEDSYEEKVLGFLTKHANNGILDSREFSAKIESLRKKGWDDDSALISLSVLQNEMLDLKNGPGEDLGHEFVTLHLRERSATLAVPFLLMTLVSILVQPLGGIYPEIKICFFASSLLFLQALVPVIASRTVFGKWKADYYKEKQEWDAFRAFLGDFAMMQKYAPSDLVIWKEWLVYGTALGVGDSVSRAMENLKVPDLPEAKTLSHFPTYFDHAYEHASEHVTTKAEQDAASNRDSGGWSSGGGFGDGGGGGGGGGGAR